MIREIRHFFKYGPAIQRKQRTLGLVGFLKDSARDLDAEGFGEMRTRLVRGLEGDILEIGAARARRSGTMDPRLG